MFSSSCSGPYSAWHINGAGSSTGNSDAGYFLPVTAERIRLPFLAAVVPLYRDNDFSVDLFAVLGGYCVPDMIKVEDLDALKMDLDESIETMEVRIGSLERQENSLKEKYTALQETINKAMGNVQQ